MRQLSERREFTEQLFEKLQSSVTEAKKLADGIACVYATGSFGRGEASQFSDLDLFIVSDVEGEKRKLSRLNEILIKADLIKAADQHSLERFSGDGEYLISYSVGELIHQIGQRNDDSENTLTARLLLLLESRPLVGADVHKRVIKAVVEEYWKDYADHPNGFIPAFLTNDILRLWRTFCLNYEASLRRMAPDKKAKGKLKNYKLRHSRMLTCFSAVMYLLCIFRQRETVSQDDAVNMALMNPFERLKWIKSQIPALSISIDKLMSLYEAFLEKTNKDEDSFVGAIEEDRGFLDNSSDFGDKVFEIMKDIGDLPAARPFYRLLMV